MSSDMIRRGAGTALVTPVEKFEEYRFFAAGREAAPVKADTFCQMATRFNYSALKAEPKSAEYKAYTDMMYALEDIMLLGRSRTK